MMLCILSPTHLNMLLMITIGIKHMLFPDLNPPAETARNGSSQNQLVLLRCSINRRYSHFLFLIPCLQRQTPLKCSMTTANPVD